MHGIKSQYTKKELHSRDATVFLIDFLWFNVVHYSSLFQYFFFQSTMVPTLVENSLVLVHL